MNQLETRVTDGNRTRDNRYHNPPLKKTLRGLSSYLRACVSAQTRACARVGAPGADSGTDLLESLRRVTSGVCP